MLERQASKVRERCRDTAVTAANPSCPPKTPMLRDGWEDENHWKWQKCWDFLCGLTVCCWLQKAFCLNLYKASILEAALTQTMDRFDMIWFCTYVLKNKKCQIATLNLRVTEIRWAQRCARCIPVQPYNNLKRSKSQTEWTDLSTLQPW